MRYAFTQGQIIPKKLGKQFFDVHSSARHALKWGANVEVEIGLDFCKILAASEGPAVSIPRTPARRRKNGTFQKYPVAIRNIHFVGCTSAVWVTR